MGRNAKDKRDIYYRLAKQKEYRSRSAFKLIQIDFFAKLFNKLELNDIIVDLCSSPGGWSQVCSNKIKELKSKSDSKENSYNYENNYDKNNDIIINNKDSNKSLNLKENQEVRDDTTSFMLINSDKNIISKNQCLVDSNENDISVIAIDVQKMGDIPGVYMIQGDITNQNTLVELKKQANNKKIKFVICDGAPDITGNTEFDLYVQNHLVYAALNFAIKTLSTGGCFISKIYKSKNLNILLSCLQQFFDKTLLLKPKSCRNASYELFVVCEGFNWEKYINFKFKKTLTNTIPSNTTFNKHTNNDCVENDNEIIMINNGEMLNYKKERLNSLENLESKKFNNEEFLVTDLEYLSNMFTLCVNSNLDQELNLLEEENILFSKFSLFSIGVEIIQVGEEQHDSDKTYNLESTNYISKLDPVQMPIDPPYKAYCNSIKGVSLQK